MKTREEIQAMLDETVNPMLQQHGGRADIIKIESGQALITMSGGCQGCAGAKYTLNLLISNKIKEFEPLIMDVVDVTDHNDKTKAYYKE